MGFGVVELRFDHIRHRGFATVRGGVAKRIQD